MIGINKIQLLLYIISSNHLFYLLISDLIFKILLSIECSNILSSCSTIANTFRMTLKILKGYTIKECSLFKSVKAFTHINLLCSHLHSDYNNVHLLQFHLHTIYVH